MEIVGAVKIKDGLFLGDEFAAQVSARQDLEFVVANKVTYIVNTSARQIPNHWEPIGVQYLDLYWLDHDVQQLLDPRDELVTGLCDFIDKGTSLGESVLVHSVKGQSRSMVVILIYLMRTYSWTMEKSLEFVSSRRPNLVPRQTFVTQVKTYEARLAKQKPLSSNWDGAPTDPEEATMRTTFFNSQVGHFAETMISDHRHREGTIQWLDTQSGQTITEGSKGRALNRVEEGFAVLKSSLKGGRERGEYRVPVAEPPTPKKPVKPGKPDAFSKSVKAQEAPVFASGTAEDAMQLRRPRFDPPALDSALEGSKKPRALSAGSKDQKKPTALHRMRFGPVSKAGNSMKAMSAGKTYSAYTEGRGATAGLELYGKAAKKTRMQTAPSSAAKGPKGKGFSRTAAPRSAGAI